MNWKHVVLIALAAAMALICAITHTCGSDASTLHAIQQLAATIIGGVFGNMQSAKSDSAGQK